MKHLFTIFCLFFACCGFSQTEGASPMETFSGSDFTLQHPVSWVPDTSHAMGTQLILFSPLENDGDKFRENVSLIIQNLSGTQIDLEEYRKITEQQIASMVTDGKVRQSMVLKTGKDDQYRITYSGTVGVFKVEVTSICYIKHEKAYLLTFTAEFGKYEQYITAGEGMLDSFTLTN